MIDWLQLARQQADRFWRKVNKHGPILHHMSDPCWMWRAGKDKDGYGKFAISAPSGTQPKQKHVRAHRLSYELTHGPVDSILVIMHACDNEACVNPSHLSVGTQTDNRIDCGSKGRNAIGDASGSRRHPESRPRGATHYKAQISEDIAKRIIALLTLNMSAAQIARDLSIQRNLVYGIKYGRTWKHLPRPDKLSLS